MNKIGRLKKSGLQCGCLISLVVYSAMLAFWTEWPWPFIVFSCLMFVSLFHQVGWVIPVTLTGFYFGMFAGVPNITHGRESEGREFLAWIVAGTLSGLLIGILIDQRRGNASLQQRAGRAENYSEQRGAQEDSAEDFICR